MGIEGPHAFYVCNFCISKAIATSNGVETERQRGMETEAKQADKQKLFRQRGRAGQAHKDRQRDRHRQADLHPANQPMTDIEAKEG